jgi:hypothetical protein
MSPAWPADEQADQPVVIRCVGAGKPRRVTTDPLVRPR